jgi:cytochrome c6
MTMTRRLKTVRIVTLTLFAAALCLSCLGLSVGSDASAQDSGEGLFNRHCASCHPEGGNILNPKRTLKKRDLDENNISSAADIVKIIRSGGPAPKHPQAWSGMKKFDEKELPEREALKIADYVLKTFR